MKQIIAFVNTAYIIVGSSCHTIRWKMDVIGNEDLEIRRIGVVKCPHISQVALRLSEIP